MATAPTTSRDFSLSVGEKGGSKDNMVTLESVKGRRRKNTPVLELRFICKA